MAYNPVKRAAREARFRAEHGVSTGTWYRMRRQAVAQGIKPTTFDKLAKQQGYQTAKRFTVAKRTLSRDYDRGIKPSASDMQTLYPIDYDDARDYDLDLEWFYYH
jgi:hypothetical protein